MAHELTGQLEIEDRGAVLVVRVDGGPHALFGRAIAAQLEELVDRADRDPGVRAVVLTGAHPGRFVSHADVRWLQEGGAAVPPVGRRGAAAIVRTVENVDRARVMEHVVSRTPLGPAVQLDRLHATFLRMNRSGVTRVLSQDGQELMLSYLETTDATGELPLYNPDTYAQALESGSVPGIGPANGVVSRR